MAIDLVVRDLAHTDLDSLLGLYEHLHERDDPLPSREIVDSLWSRIVDDANQIYLGGFIQGRLVSACNAAVVPNLTRGARPYAVIENVVTASSVRRQGIGSRVLRSLLDRCWARGCYKVMLMSGAARADFYGFYDALGFDRSAKQAFVIAAP
jgi:GNAT superfamily N-acetyltransferase